MPVPMRKEDSSYVHDRDADQMPSRPTRYHADRVDTTGGLQPLPIASFLGAVAVCAANVIAATLFHSPGVQARSDGDARPCNQPWIVLREGNIRPAEE